MRSKNNQSQVNHKNLQNKVGASHKRHPSQQKKKASSPSSKKECRGSFPSKKQMTGDLFRETRASFSYSEIYPNNASMNRLNDFEVQQLLHQNQIKNLQSDVEVRKNKNATKKNSVPNAPFAFRQSISRQDEIFNSGAWLFDLEVAPYWFKKALHKNSSKSYKQTGHSVPILELMTSNPLPNSKLKGKARRKQTDVFDDELLPDKNTHSSRQIYLSPKSSPKQFQSQDSKQKRLASVFLDVEDFYIESENTLRHQALSSESSSDTRFVKKVVSTSESSNSFSATLQQKNKLNIETYQPPIVDANIEVERPVVDLQSDLWSLDNSNSTSWLSSHLKFVPFYEKQFKSKTNPPILERKIQKKLKRKLLRKKTENINAPCPIETGAWLFDLNTTPAWFQALIKKHPDTSTLPSEKQFNSETQTSPEITVNTTDDMSFDINSCSWPFDFNTTPDWFQNLFLQPYTPRRLSGFSCHTPTQMTMDQLVYLKPCPVRLPTVYTHEDIGFYSGGWLFDSHSMPEWFKNAFNTENLKRRNDDVIEESNQSKRQKHNELKSVFSKETIFKNGEELNDVHYFFDSPMSPQWFNRYLPSSLISSICLDKFSQFKSLAYPFNSYYASGLHANNFQPTSSFHYVSISPSSQWGSYDNKHPVSFIPLSDLSAQKQHSQIPLTGNNTFAKAPIHCENSIFPWLRNEIPEYESQEQESFDRFLTAFQKPFWTVQVSI